MTDKPPIIAIVQARLGSSRLPNKELLFLPSASKTTVIQRVLSRVSKSELVDRVILACPLSDVPKFNELGANVCVWPDVNDVLSRFIAIILRFPKNTIFVRITGDCPCILPELIDRGIKEHLEYEADYTRLRNDIQDSMVGDGLDFEIFSGLVLIEAAEIISLTKEHVCPILYHRSFKVHKVEADLPDVKLSIDSQEDYTRVDKIYETLGADFDQKQLYEHLNKKE